MSTKKKFKHKKSKKTKKNHNDFVDPYLAREAQRYDNPMPSREFILAFIKQHRTPLSTEGMIEKLGLDPDISQIALQRRFKAMARESQLLKLKNGLYWPTAECLRVKGVVVRSRDKEDWVLPENGAARIRVVSSHSCSVRAGDQVLILVPNLKHSDYQQGEIIEVLSTRAVQLTGRFVVDAGIGYVIPHSREIKEDILIPKSQQKDSQDGEIVLVEIVSMGCQRRSPVGKVLEVLGNENTKGIEIESVIRSFELPYEWPEAVKSNLSKIKSEISEYEIRKRVDLRHLPFVTIDGEDAKDFDDAVFCHPNTRGGFTLYVAIADVSFYVKENSPLDKEAQKRGNSVYFPGKVIPMLPEKLSNNLCSLRPDSNKLCLVCVLSINQKGIVTKYVFQEAIIRSQARLTYTKVAKILEDPRTHLRKQYAQLLEPIFNLEKLYELLYHAREQRGAIDFETVETRILFNKKGKISQIEPITRNVAHKIIEECMLAANVATAKFMKTHKLPGVFRVHEGPTNEKLNDLRKFLEILGFHFSPKAKPTPKDYSDILKKIKHRDDSHIIQMIMLRSLSQAIYSPDNIGHFGLAYDEYAHFTSPIRRYPDLLVHRLIRLVLRGKWDAAALSEKKLAHHTEAAHHASMTERRADEATREVAQWLKCHYLRKYVGEDFKGIISGVTSFGFFVELVDLYVEGLVHVSNLHGDFYQYDSVQHCLKGERSNICYRLGDSVAVKISKINLDERQIDFALLYDTPKQAKKSKKSFLKKSHSKTRKKRKQQS